MKLYVFTLIVSLALVGCSKPYPIIDPDDQVLLLPSEKYVSDKSEYSLVITENLDQGYYEIDFQSLSEHKMCILFWQWPFKNEFPDTSEVFSVSIDDEKYYYDKGIDAKYYHCGPYNTFGAPKSCRYEVPSKSQLKAKLLFNGFPKIIFKDKNAKRTLNLPLRPVYCPATSE